MTGEKSGSSSENERNSFMKVYRKKTNAKIFKLDQIENDDAYFDYQSLGSRIQELIEKKKFLKNSFLVIALVGTINHKLFYPDKPIWNVLNLDQFCVVFSLYRSTIINPYMFGGKQNIYNFFEKEDKRNLIVLNVNYIEEIMNVIPQNFMSHVLLTTMKPYGMNFEFQNHDNHKGNEIIDSEYYTNLKECVEISNKLKNNNIFLFLCGIYSLKLKNIESACRNICCCMSKMMKILLGLEIQGYCFIRINGNLNQMLKKKNILTPEELILASKKVKITLW